MGYQEFLHVLQKRGSNPHKLSHCFGARDAWKWVRKNKWSALKGHRCDSSTYGNVIDLVNTLLAEKLLEGHEIEFPYQMGSLKLRGTKSKVDYVDGKLKSNYRIDWKKTLDYWYKDLAARKQRYCIKKIEKYIYSIAYSKQKAKFKNQKFYMFRLNRSLVRALGDKVQKEKMNALIY